MEMRPAIAANARRLVVKVGSSLLIGRRGLRRRWLSALAADAAALHREGRQIVIVSSGAVGLGRSALGGALTHISDRQAAAAIGQVALSDAWRQALGRHGLKAAQILLTPDDTENRRRHLNARATLQSLLRHGVVPVINENDTTATDELKFGDNDRLAARVAQLISADLVILLSDVDGLYSDDPRRDRTARHLPLISDLSPEIEAMAGGAGSGLGTGGMASKLAAARIALNAGAHLVIASGVASGSLGALFNGARASWFVPNVEPVTARKAWIAATVKPRGRLLIDRGAVTALSNGRSLLAVGVRAVEGRFAKGDPVSLVGEQGDQIAIGLVNYDDRETARIMGHHSEMIAELLGYPGPDVLIHRDNLVVSKGRRT